MKTYVYLPTSIRPRCIELYNELKLESLVISEKLCKADFKYNKRKYFY